MFGIEDFFYFILIFIVWWVISFVFQRIMHRYPKVNSFKKDLFITGIWSFAIFLVFVPAYIVIWH